jgi:hypothetical protein
VGFFQIELDLFLRRISLSQRAIQKKDTKEYSNDARR